MVLMDISSRIILESKVIDYRSAGVDIDKGDQLVSRIKEMLGSAGKGLGHFGGAIAFPVDKYKHPLMISSIDGVGTKVKIAAAMGKYDTIGSDLVNHSINDIACCGAEPLAFLDYIAMSSIDVDVAADVIQGIVNACKKWDISLAGGENAEMPGVYKEGELDLVGSIFGVVEQSKYINGESIKAGDVLIGFPSNGLHTNGYSLARNVVSAAGKNYDENLPELGTTIGEALLKVHYCYLGEIRNLLENFETKGLAHITGGGIPGNVSRIMPKGLSANVDYGCWNEPPIFDLLRKWGQTPEDDMRSTYNLGIGLIAVFDGGEAEKVLKNFPGNLVQPVRIGVVE